MGKGCNSGTTLSTFSNINSVGHCETQCNHYSSGSDYCCQYDEITDRNTLYSNKQGISTPDVTMVNDTSIIVNQILNT